jgi:hypothetical protein
MQTMWLKIDVGLPRVLRRGPRLERQMAVSSTQIPLRGLSTIPYLMIQLVPVPSVLLESFENIMARSAILSEEMWRITEIDDERFVSVLVLRIGCPSRLPSDTWK